MKNIDQAPGPTPWLPAALIWQLRKRPLEFLSSLAAEYGDIVQFRLATQRICLLNHPDYIQEVLVKQGKSFAKGQAIKRSAPLLGKGLLTNEGDDHLRQRRLIQPAFHRQRISGYGDSMVCYAKRQTQRWQDGSEIDMHEDMMRLTLAIVGQTLFQADIEEDAPQVGAALNEILSQFRRLMSPLAPIMEHLPLPANKRFQESLDVLDNLVTDLIEERRNSGDMGDVISMLLMAQEDGQGMSDKQLRDEVMTLLLAGHETTANALSWVWHLLSQHPEIDEKLCSEWSSVLAGRDPKAADLPQLVYTKQVVSEAMRLYPPAWIIGRQAQEDVAIGEYLIPAGTLVLVSQYITHRDARYYPEPDRFDPERWTLEEITKRPKYSYFPFGAGSRFCIGERFAWMEGILLLATIGQRWHFEPAPGSEIVPLPRVTLRPQNGLPLIARKRQTDMNSVLSGNCKGRENGKQLPGEHDLNPRRPQPADA